MSSGTIKLRYTMASGISNSIFITTDQANEWLSCYKENRKFIIQIDKNVVGIQPDLVANFFVDSFHKENDVTNFVMDKDIELIEPVEVPFYVTCTCGANYYRILDINREHSLCMVCKKNRVFADYSEGVIEGRKGKGYYMTNTKYVYRNLKRPELLVPKSSIEDM